MQDSEFIVPSCSEYRPVAHGVHTVRIPGPRCTWEGLKVDVHTECADAVDPRQ